MHQVHPTESFFNKGVRLANQGISLVGTLKGLYDAGKFVYGGVRAAAPMMAMLA